LRKMRRPDVRGVVWPAAAALVWLIAIVNALAGPSPHGSAGVEASARVEAHADLDGDGRLDLIMATCGADCRIDVVLSRRASTLRLDTGGPIRGMIAADVDRDGDADLITLRRDGVVVVWTK